MMNNSLISTIATCKGFCDIYADKTLTIDDARMVERYYSVLQRKAHAEKNSKVMDIIEEMDATACEAAGIDPEQWYENDEQQIAFCKALINIAIARFDDIVKAAA